MRRDITRLLRIKSRIGLDVFWQMMILTRKLNRISNNAIK